MADDSGLEEGKGMSKDIKVEEGGACKGREGMDTNTMLWG